MRILVLAVAIVALAVAARGLAANLPAGFREAPALEPAASWVAGKPVRVNCVRLVSDSYEDGMAVPGSSEIAIDGQYLCPALLARLSGRRADPVWLAGGLMALAHEAEHAAGHRDESETDCAALKALPIMAVKFFGYRLRSRQLHDLMAVAWDLHRSAPPEYRTTC